MASKEKGKAAQDFVPINEIRDGVMVTENKHLHIVLMASSINFALRSTEEQEAITAQYQNFLNSLDFSVQIIIQSRRLNIDPYLETLRDAEREQTNELLQIQTREYVEFVKTFVASTKIVTKSFYIVVTFVPPVLEASKRGVKSIMDKFTGGSQEGSRKKYTADEQFEEYKTQLWQRVEVVTTTLASAGVRTVPLNTEELIELYFGLFNPGELERGHAPQVTQ